jgi:phospholipid transport system transporter-binding protein
VSELAIDTAPDRVRVSGSLGFTTPVAALRDADRVVTGAARGTVATVDLAGIDGADSATLAILLAWSAHARRNGARLRYVNMPDDLGALARLADATELLDGPR